MIKQLTVDVANPAGKSYIRKEFRDEGASSSNFVARKPALHLVSWNEYIHKRFVEAHDSLRRRYISQRSISETLETQEIKLLVV